MCFVLASEGKFIQINEDQSLWYLSKIAEPSCVPHNRSAAAASPANELFVAVGQAKRFRTMAHLVLNSEPWAWMIICAAWIGTAALLLTRWMRQEAPRLDIHG